VGNDSRAIFSQYRQARGFAVPPLNHKGRWIGAIHFFGEEPVAFDERDERIFTVILQHVAPVVDTIRSKVGSGTSG
jgi:hypothetical protein